MRTARTDELPDLINDMAAGKSLRSVCDRRKVDAPNTLRRLQADPALKAAYLEARQMRAHGFAEDIAEICVRTLNGDYEPAAARVAIDELKWIASKMDAGSWGERVAVTNADGLNMSFVALVNTIGEPDGAPSGIAELKSIICTD